jgi:superfamily II DNA or RNA helicase
VAGCRHGGDAAILRLTYNPTALSTPYHAAYWATALGINDAGGSVADLSRSLANARVDLNPHQVDAALFAIRSPLSKGVILADEVGLGKTIEAGLVLAQRWAERRRRILLVVPASLRKQWQEELRQKFSLPATIMDGKTAAAERASGRQRPFDRHDEIIITSYQFAAAHADEVGSIPWDLVVFDEAHRLRNVYRQGSRIAGALRDATEGRKKLLLTATPLQNSLLELYGLASFLDPHLFGDERSFREQFGGGGGLDASRASQLRWRLRGAMTRTLRAQVLEYVRFTNRIPITQDFRPSDAEQRLYDLVSEYLQRPVLAAIPSGQRALITLVLRRLLASSTFAIAATLRTLVERLELMLRDRDPMPVAALILPDLDEMDDLAEEFLPQQAGFDLVSRDEMLTELADLRSFAQLAESITVNAKGVALLAVLATALDRAEGLGAARKAVVFTESRRTQEYLSRLLEANGYAGRVVQLNGSNSDANARELYNRWMEEHRGTAAATGSRPIDTRAAIVDAFKGDVTILIATEAAAEGVNLQFCSLVVNYDLPWNPQRIEQRIGRCHRYGQKHDVVVVNLLNRANAADERVFEILSIKFRLFEGVFGASDEVLGVLESGLDFERRIAGVYQSCRTNAEIVETFDTLQAELETQIAGRLDDTRRSVLEHFDEDVQSRLRVHREVAQESLAERQRWLWELSRLELGADARFDSAAPRFHYAGALGTNGDYNLDWSDAERRDEHFYRPEHALAQAVVERALGRELPEAALTLDLSGHQPSMEALRSLDGASGTLACGKLAVRALRDEEHLILAGITDVGLVLDDDQCRRLMRLRVLESGPASPGADQVIVAREGAVARVLAEVNQRNSAWYDEEVIKLDAWAEDLRTSLERELRELDRAIGETRRASLASATLAEKLAAQRSLKALESERAAKRRALYDAQDRIGERRDELIASIERQLGATHTWSEIFLIRWRLG